MKIIINILVMLLVLLFVVWGDRAFSDDRRRPFTIGVGAGLGVGKHLEADGGSDISFINVTVIRARFFWMLGLDYEFNLGRSRELTGDHEFRELNYHAKMRLSVLLYSFSFSNSAFYLRGGVGSAKLNELFSIEKAGASYHGGFGVELDLDMHTTFDLSFTIVLPGTQSIIERSIIDLEIPSPMSFLNFRNHELVARLMIFL